MFVTNYNAKEPHDFFEKHKREWKKSLTKSYFKSTSIRNFSFIKFLRFISALCCPALYKYTRFSELKKLIKQIK